MEILILIPLVLLLEPIFHETGHVIGAEITGTQVTGIDIISVHPDTYIASRNMIIVIFGPMATLIWSSLFACFNDWKAQFIAMGLALSTAAYMFCNYGDAVAMRQSGYWWIPYLLAIFGVTITMVSFIKVYEIFKLTNRKVMIADVEKSAHSHPHSHH